MNVADLPPQIRSKILVDDCWIWTLGITPNGYGKIKWKRRTLGVHRVVYELLVGPVPEGKLLHHRCLNRRCCNPAHLEPLTPLEHQRLEGARRNIEKTHCLRGHPFDEINTYFHREKRECRECVRQAKRRYRARKKEWRSILTRQQ